MVEKEDSEEETISFQEGILEEICRSVKRFYPHILLDGEVATIDAILVLDPDARKLLYSLSRRKRKYFFPSSCRVNLVDLKKTVDSLQNTGCLVSCQEEDAYLLLPELSMKNLRTLAHALGMDSVATQKDYSSKKSIVSFFKSIRPYSYKMSRVTMESRILKAVNTTIEQPYQINANLQLLLKKIHLLFSPCTSQIAVTVGALGKVEFPSYTLFPSYPFFPSRHSFHIFELILRLSPYLAPTYLCNLSRTEIQKISICCCNFIQALWSHEPESVQPVVPSLKKYEMEYITNSIPEEPSDVVTFIDQLLTEILKLMVEEDDKQVMTPMEPSYVVNLREDSNDRGLYSQLCRIVSELVLEPESIQYVRFYTSNKGIIVRFLVRFLHFLDTNGCFVDSYQLAYRLLMTNYLDSTSFAWYAFCIAYKRTTPAHKFVDLLYMALQLSEPYGDYQKKMQRKLNKFLRSSLRADIAPLKLPCYTVRYLNQRPIQGRVGHKNIYYNENDDQLTVEEVALQHYQEVFDYEGMKDEGRSFRSLAWLLFWDVIFIPLPYAFQNPYQKCPADFGSRTFYLARKEYLDYLRDRLVKLSDEELEVFLTNSIQAHRNLASGVDWAHFDEQWLIRIAKGLGSYRCVNICYRLLTQWELLCRGFPDLLMIRESSKNVGMPKVLMVEVKGENDEIREDQLDWIEYFENNGINVEVCRLTSSHQTDETELIGKETYWKEVSEWEGEPLIVTNPIFPVRAGPSVKLQLPKELEELRAKASFDEEREEQSQVTTSQEETKETKENSQVSSSQEQTKKRSRLSLSQDQVKKELAKKRSAKIATSGTPSILQFFSKKPAVFFVC